ncbi:MAG: tRNA glutamyl-Q(34) synthetase GluQRS [Gammaproteobacteria bacterium]|nr:tRNA glutamyl-Q(34) synthetase GluQRS [Gammaproteobacteria bacterium]
MSAVNTDYVGRFAPTPSGPLHFGSIITALASYLDARANHGKWLVRIDDLDSPRTQKGADSKILSTLEELGMYWDNQILYQSQRNDAYQSVLEQLHKNELIYACYCSRDKTRGKPYPGSCRNLTFVSDKQYALRIIVEEGELEVDDLIQQSYFQNLKSEVGDFVIRRADQITAYHLAVVVDDAYQNVSHIIRGADLLESCARQIYLQNILRLPGPLYAHVPLATYTNGAKISKQEQADYVLLTSKAGHVLYACLRFLGQTPAQELQNETVEKIIQWGIANWNLSKVPQQHQLSAPTIFQKK